MYQFIKIWDLWHYFLNSGYFLNGKAFSLEYPSGAVIPMILPRLATSDFMLYSWLFHIQTFIVFLIGFFFLIKLTNRAWLYILPFFLLFPLAIELLDIYVVVAMFLSLYFFQKNKFVKSAMLLFIGISIKFWPILLIPLLAIKSKKYTIYSLVAFLSAIVLFSNIYSLKFHFERGVQPESTAGSIIQVINKKETEYKYNAIQIKDSSLPLIVPLAVMALGYIFAFKNKNIFISSFYIILSFILGSKVFSPQYLLWLSPFLPFLKIKKSVLVITATILTTWYLGYYEKAIIDFVFPYNLSLLLRNLALILSFFI